MFSKHYYTTKVKAAVDKEVKKIRKVDPQEVLAERMRVLQRVTREVYSKQPAEIHERVKVLLVEQEDTIAEALRVQKEKNDDEDENFSADHYNRYFFQ